MADSIFKFVSQIRTFKDAAFYPVIDTALILTTVAAVRRNKPPTAAAAAVRCSASPLTQCCYAMLTTLAIIQCSSWADAHFPLSVAALPPPTMNPAGYYTFQLANLLGIYRSLSGHISTDIWHQMFYASLHAFLLLTNLDTQSQSILSEVKHLFFHTQERRLLSIKKDRDIRIDDIDELPERMRLSSLAKEFKYDVNEPLFLLRAIVRFIWRPMIPLYIIGLLINIAMVGSTVLYSHVWHIIDQPAEHSWYTSYVIVILASLVETLLVKFDWIGLQMKYEISRITNVVKLELSRLPLTNTGLRKEQTFRKAMKAAHGVSPMIGTIQHITGRLANAVVTFMLIYRQIGWLAFLPGVVSFAMPLLEHILTKVLGGRNQWKANSSRFEYKADIGELYHNIKSIKMFGWERMYVDPELQKHWSDEAYKRAMPWYAPVVRFIWFIFDTFKIISTQFSAYITICLYTVANSGSEASISSADMFQLNALISNLIYRIDSIRLRLSSFSGLIGDYYMLEKAFKGDFVHALPRYPLESVDERNLECRSNPSVTLESCDFSMKMDECVLEDISFTADDGELVAVVGKTGSGKSSLLLSVCGEIEMTKGTGAVFGSIALMEQTPWIMNDTVRKNILFGRDYDEGHYNRVVDACALAEDISNWTGGDQTVIGERGINISGGQKARLALARTVYSKADIYVLDDPLSAVDAHVKRHILDNVIMDSGLLGGKIRIVSVNVESLLPYCNQVVRLDSGRASVTKQDPQEFQPRVNIHSAESDEVKPYDPETIDPPENVDLMLVSPIAECSGNTGSDSRDELSTSEDDNTSPGIREWGKWDNLRYIVGICGIPTLMTIALTGLVGPIFDFIIDGYKMDSLDFNTRAGIASNDAVLRYIQMNMLARVVEKVLHVIEMFVETSIADTHLATRLKSTFVDNLIHTPLSFFDSTTSAAIGSVYESGASSISHMIPHFILYDIPSVLKVILVSCRVARNAPVLLLLVPLLGWYGTKCILSLYPMERSISNIQEETSNSQAMTRNIISDGERLIRILNVETYFTKLRVGEMDNETRLGRAVNSFSAMLDTMKWLICEVSYLVSKVCILAHSHLFGYNISSSGFVAYEELVQDFMNVAKITELPSSLHSINESISVFRQYTGMDREDKPSESVVEPPSNWPTVGKIEFRNFSMKYRSDLEYALKDINLAIYPGEKIGIIGRTGAGKTSLSRSLFRLISSNTCEGSILIDGCDISSISTTALRPKLGTIPQESTLFSGSFKQNLDPLLEYSIEDMWAALVKCNITRFVMPKRGSNQTGDYFDDEEDARILKEIAEWDQEWEKAGWIKRAFLFLFAKKPKCKDRINRKVKHGLDRDVGDHSRFSNGQKQLFSLCRLLMRKHKIIVLDEATADVDAETDQEMQKLFRSEFKDSTVLTIAHRLETIMNSDRIIVMDKGRVVEFGPPSDLIKDGGYFAELVKANDF